MNEKQRLLQYISEVSFAVVDINLYLDTHLYDEEALRYYEKYRDMRKEAMREYQRMYGPLLATDVKCKNKWTWVNDPWPWEGAC